MEANLQCVCWSIPYLLVFMDLSRQTQVFVRYVMPGTSMYSRKKRPATPIRCSIQ